MWEFIDGVTAGIRRPSRRSSRANVIPAMLIGAGVGIAAWEMAKRRINTTGAIASVLGNDSTATPTR